MNNLEKYKPIKLHWFLELLGFNVGFDTIVISDPKLVEEGYEYEVKIISKIYYWLGIELKRINYE